MWDVLEALAQVLHRFDGGGAAEAGVDAADARAPGRVANAAAGLHVNAGVGDDRRLPLSENAAAYSTPQAVGGLEQANAPPTPRWACG